MQVLGVLVLESERAGALGEQGVAWLHLAGLGSGEEGGRPPADPPKQPAAST